MITSFGIFRSFREPAPGNPCVEVNFTNTGNFTQFYQVTSCDGLNILMDLNPGETSVNYCVTDNSWVLDADITIQIIGGCLNDGDITSPPAPSPSPSPSYNAIYISEGGSANATAACEIFASELVYYAGTLGNGTILYTDSGLTTPKAGAKLWYSMGTSNVGTIGNTGIVGNFGFCSINPI